MKKSQLLLAIFCLFILSYQTFTSELPTTKYGFTAAYNRIVLNGDELNYTVDPLYPYFISIAGDGLSIGAVLLTPINLISSSYFQSRLKMNINYDYFFNINTEKHDFYPSLVEDNSNNPVLWHPGYFVSKDYNRIYIELLYSLKLSSIGLVLNLGPLCHYTILNNETRSAYIGEGISGRLDTIASILDFPVKKDVIRYEDNFRTAVYQDGADKSLDSIAFGFSGGISYEFRLGELTLSPGINYKYQTYFQNILFSLDVLF